MRGIRGQDERKAPAVSDQLCCSLLIQGVNHLCSYAVEDVGQGGSRLKKKRPSGDQLHCYLYSGSNRHRRSCSAAGEDIGTRCPNR